MCRCVIVCVGGSVSAKIFVCACVCVCVHAHFLIKSEQPEKKAPLKADS